MRTSATMLTKSLQLAAKLCFNRLL